MTIRIQVKCGALFDWTEDSKAAEADTSEYPLKGKLIAYPGWASNQFLLHGS